MDDIGVGFLYVDVTFRDGVFLARVPGETNGGWSWKEPDIIAVGDTLEQVRNGALRWADVNRNDLPVRFRYSERAKLAMA